MNQFRSNPAQWLNNLAKQKNHQGNINSGFPVESQAPDLSSLNPGTPFWNEQANIRNLNGGNSLGNPDSTTLDDTNIDVPCLVPNSPNNPGKLGILFPTIIHTVVL